MIIPERSAQADGELSSGILTAGVAGRAALECDAGRLRRLVGFAGALLIISQGSGLADPAVLLLPVSSACYALYQIATRWVAAYDGAATGIVFSALIDSPAMRAVPPAVFVWRNLFDLALFISLGPIGGGHCLLIRAFQ